MTRGAYVHDALYFATDSELLDFAVPFLRDGFARGERGVVACDERRTRLIVDALGGDHRLSLLERLDVYRRPARAVSIYQQMMERQVALGTPGIRLLGEAEFGPGPLDWAEWCCYEAAVNHALAPYPLWAVCLYDTRRLSEEILRAGRLTHPHLVAAGTRRPSPGYLHPTDYLRRATANGVLDPLQQKPPDLEVEELTDPARLRRALGETLAQAGAEEEAAADFLGAVAEVVDNAVRYGLPPVDVRLWVSADRLLCTVTDRGPGVEDPLVGYVPRHRSDLSAGPMGLWLARRLCNHLDFPPTEGGFTVRLRTSLDPR